MNKELEAIYEILTDAEALIVVAGIEVDNPKEKSAAIQKLFRVEALLSKANGEVKKFRRAKFHEGTQTVAQ